MDADSATVRLRVAVSEGLWVPGRDRRQASGGDACVQEARQQDFHFWSAESGVDTVWPYWNLMDFTPEGRPDRLTPPQNFRPEFFEKNILNK